MRPKPNQCHDVAPGVVLIVLERINNQSATAAATGAATVTVASTVAATVAATITAASSAGGGFNSESHFQLYD